MADNLFDFNLECCFCRIFANFWEDEPARQLLTTFTNNFFFLFSFFFFFAELMVLGFISLLLTFCQSYIAKICIPLKAAHSMLPCSEVEATKETDRRRLLWEDFIPDSGLQRRFLAGAGSAPKCATVSVSSYYTDDDLFKQSQIK